jgi:biopolymer transport protein ExbD
MKSLAFTLVGSTCLATVGCQQRSAHLDPPYIARFVLGIGQDRSLTLDRKPIKRENLDNEWPQLASWVRDKARVVGVKASEIVGLPAVIVVWAADETPYSIVHSIMFEAQANGFLHCVLVPKSRREDPFQMPLAAAVRVRPNNLPETLRTMPIRLRADDQGNMSSLRLGEIELRDFKALESEVSKIQDDPDTSFDQAFLSIDSHLKFVELARVAHLLAKHRIADIGSGPAKPEDDD